MKDLRLAVGRVFDGQNGDRRQVRHIDREEGVVRFVHMEPKELKGREERTTLTLFQGWAKEQVRWI